MYNGVQSKRYFHCDLCFNYNDVLCIFDHDYHGSPRLLQNISHIVMKTKLGNFVSRFPLPPCLPCYMYLPIHL
jgi:hypothetical protein